MSNETTTTEEETTTVFKTTTINLMEVDQVKLFVADELKKFKAEFDEEYLEPEPTQEEIEAQTKAEEEQFQTLIAGVVEQKLSELSKTLKLAIENTVRAELARQGINHTTLESIVKTGTVITSQPGILDEIEEEEKPKKRTKKQLKKVK